MLSIVLKQTKTATKSTREYYAAVLHSFNGQYSWKTRVSWYSSQVKPLRVLLQQEMIKVGSVTTETSEDLQISRHWTHLCTEGKKIKR